MKNKYLKQFDKIIQEKVFSALSRFSFTMKKSNEIEYQFDSSMVTIKIGFYESHRINVTTTITPKNHLKKMLGLNLILKIRNPEYELWNEDIKSNKELKCAIEQQLNALTAILWWYS